MPFEIGAMFHAADSLTAALSELRAHGFSRGQMAVPEALANREMAADWNTALQTAQFTMHTLFGVYDGESYADIDTVRKTVGFMPRETRVRREAATMELIELAAAMNVPGIATHIGCLPESPRDGDYLAVLAMVQRIADAAARRKITFALETGQESAEALVDFLTRVDHPNVGVNFDPANMILYGNGDPIEALETVGQHVLTVHAKDGVPPKSSGALGTEMPIGKGKVPFPAFLTVLRKIGYDGPLFIERETEDTQTRLNDMQHGKEYLERIGFDI